MSDEFNDDNIIKMIVFDKYKPEKKIGEGSFGKIFSAIRISDQKKFALKIVKNIKLINYYLI